MSYRNPVVEDLLKTAFTVYWYKELTEQAINLLMLLPLASDFGLVSVIVVALLGLAVESFLVG
jgi:hypothetical protein